MIPGFKFLLACLALLGAGFFTGCAPSIPARPNMDGVPPIKRTISRSLIADSVISIQWVGSGYGMGGGLLGAAIDAGVNSSRKKTAELRIQPLRASTPDIDFRGRVWAELESILRNSEESAWLKVYGTERTSDPLGPVTGSDVDKRALLRFGTDYSLSPDATVLTVQTGFTLYLPGKNQRPAASALCFYRSKDISNAEDSVAVSEWSKDGAAAFRAALDEGISENIEMVRMALGYMGGKDYAGVSSKLKAVINKGRRDFGVKMGTTDVKGNILREGNERLVIMRPDGVFYSLPASAIESRVDSTKISGIAWETGAIPKNSAASLSKTSAVDDSPAAAPAGDAPAAPTEVPSEAGKAE